MRRTVMTVAFVGAAAVGVLVGTPAALASSSAHPSRAASPARAVVRGQARIADDPFGDPTDDPFPDDNCPTDALGFNTADPLGVNTGSCDSNPWLPTPATTTQHDDGKALAAAIRLIGVIVVAILGVSARRLRRQRQGIDDARARTAAVHAANSAVDDKVSARSSGQNVAEDLPSAAHHHSIRPMAPAGEKADEVREPLYDTTGEPSDTVPHVTPSGLTDGNRDAYNVIQDGRKRRKGI